MALPPRDRTRRRAAAVPREPRAEPDAAGPHRRSRGHASRARRTRARRSAHARALVEACAKCAATCRAPGDLLERAARASPAQRRRSAARQSSRAHRQAATKRWRCSTPRRRSTATRGSQRGRLLDRLGRYDEAWRDLVDGQAAAGAERPAGSPTTRRPSKRFSRGCSASSCARTSSCCRARRCARDVPQPIFIMGFPRSGTTLIEQVLSSHRAVRAGGELPFIRELRQFSLLQFAGARVVSRESCAHLDRGQALCRDAVSRLLPRARRAVRTPRARASLSSPTRCRSTRSGCRCCAWRFLQRPSCACCAIRSMSASPCLSHNLTHGFNCGYRMEDIVHHLIAVEGLVDALCTRDAD